jgi:hypothetical protein
MKKRYRLTLDFEVQSDVEKQGESLTISSIDRILDIFIDHPDKIKKYYNSLLSAIITAGNDFWGEIDEVKNLDVMTDEDILASIFKKLPSFESAYLLKLIYGELMSRDTQIKQRLIVEDFYNSLRAQNNIKVLEIDFNVV